MYLLTEKALMMRLFDDSIFDDRWHKWYIFFWSGTSFFGLLPLVKSFGGNDLLGKVAQVVHLILIFYVCNILCISIGYREIQKMCNLCHCSPNSLWDKKLTVAQLKKRCTTDLPLMPPICHFLFHCMKLLIIY